MKLIKTLTLLFTTLLLLGGAAQAQPQPKMQAHFINVGQADSILLEFPTAAVLIDAGGENTGDTRDRDRLIGYLDRFFARRTDLNRTLFSIIISHPHIDHTRLLMDVMRRYRVRSLVDGGGTRGSGIVPLNQARAFARSRRIPNIVVTDASVQALGREGFTPRFFERLRNAAPSGVDIRFLSGGARTCEDQNNNSLTVRVAYRGKKFIFTGDAEDDDPICVGGQIANLIERYGDSPGGMLDVDVYKVGHHGSRNATTEDLMQAMTPAISVISAGDRNTLEPERFHAFYFGHPREVAVRLLEEFTTTDRQPAVTVYTMRAVRRVRENRRVEKAVYCTCWDNNVVVEVRDDGSLQPAMTNQ